MRITRATLAFTTLLMAIVFSGCAREAEYPKIKAQLNSR